MDPRQRTKVQNAARCARSEIYHTAAAAIVSAAAGVRPPELNNAIPLRCAAACGPAGRRTGARRGRPDPFRVTHGRCGRREGDRDSDSATVARPQAVGGCIGGVPGCHALHVATYPSHRHRNIRITRGTGGWIDHRMDSER